MTSVPLSRPLALFLSLLLLLLVPAVRPAAAFEPALLFSYEAIPSAQVDLPGLDRANYAQRAEVATAALDVLVPEILTLMGIDPGKAVTEVTPGGYLMKTSASLQTRVSLPEGGADRLAAALGYVFRQYSVMVSRLGKPSGDTGYVAVAFRPGVLDAALAHRFFEAAAAREEGLGGGYTVFGDTMYFLNVRDSDGQPYSGLDDADFAAALKAAAAGFAAQGVMAVSVGTADARFVGNDWDRQPMGGAYVELLGGRDSPEVRALDRLRERHTELVLTMADRYGWR
jgi:hypothetical protein